MSKHRPFFLSLLPAAMMAAAVLVPQSRGAEPSTDAAQLAAYTQASGINYYALTLKPATKVAAAAQHDVVVLVNTSASQTGEYRTTALAALKGLLQNLGPADRVHVLAIDQQAVPMTPGLVKAGGPEIADALQKLEKREPMGATDLKLAFDDAVKVLSPTSAAKAIVYIGDGGSRLNPIAPPEFDPFVVRFVNHRIPVSSYGVGPALDLQLLGALAAHTGGVVLEAGKVPADQAGKGLASAADGVVLWPKKAVWPTAFTEVLPKRIPPFRMDRDSVLIGTTKALGPFDVTIDVDTPEGTKTLEWKVAATKSNDANAYLVGLIDGARPSGGMVIPLVGSESLKNAARAQSLGSAGLGKLATQALASGDKKGAEDIARLALAQDPQNDVAHNVLAALQKPSGAKKAPAAAAGDLNLQGPNAQPPAGTLMLSVEENRKLMTQQIVAEVQAVIDLARRTMAGSPDAAIQELKLQLDNVRRVPELDPGVRDQLHDRLSAAIREADRRKVTLAHQSQQARQVLAAAEEQKLVTDTLQRDQMKVDQLMQRFNALMAEGRYRMAEEEVAHEAQRIDPQNRAALAAAINARSRGYLSDALALRQQRQKAVVDTLYQVEKSYMPFPDDTPIVYPEAEAWREMSERRKREWGAVDLAGRNPNEKKIVTALNSPTKIEFFEQPLKDVLDYLRQYHQIEIQLDTKNVEDAGVASDTPITRTLQDVSLRSALRLILRDLDLTYVIKNEVLLITTPDQAQSEQFLITKVYPVGDLVISPGAMRMMGGGGMMGGMGGGMGMMGGMGGMGGMGMGGMGMGGMGMGGGMGGMGMGGMGGMGGGFFNMPQNGGGARNRMLPLNLLPNGAMGPNDGFRAFSVKDDLNLSADNTPAPVTTKGPAEPKALAIRLEIPKGANVEDAWDRHFATHKEAPAAVRETVRQLWKAKQHEQIIALVKGALRHDQAQPGWMYEAIALAMQAAGRPKEDIERAVISAVEYARTPADLLCIGLYLEQLGLNQRALQIYRQISRIDSSFPEPYLQGLRVAERTGDLEGTKWAALGILSQAWPEEHKHVWHNGYLAAQATLEKLKAEKKVEEAKDFEAALDAVVARDCVLVVSWTGDADVDLLVEEPTGTICSLRNRRTTGGGFMIGDLREQVQKENTGASSEIYVCPQAFSGTYKVLISRVWGEVTAGRVKVDLYTHFLTKNDLHFTKTIALDKNQAAIQFDLKDGRRTEPLQERQVADAVVNHLAIGQQQVLAQQLGAGFDPGTAASLANSRQNVVGGANGAPFVPFIGRGAVGYQPVIVTLPKGAAMSAMAVISADRRYVRLSPSPTFTGVSEVNTFNTSSGSSGTSNGAGFGGLGAGLGGGQGAGFGGGGTGFGGGGGGF